MDVVRLREIIEPSRGNKASRNFDLMMMTFILIALITFSLHTLPSGTLPFWAEQSLSLIELITVVVFTVEYVLRLIAAERTLRFVFSFYGIVDLLAILPFYLGLFYGGQTVDLRSVRILRLFRVFRAFKLLRYSRAIHHFGNALREVREELILYLMATAFLIFLSATGIYYFEHEVNPDFQSIFHSLWWAVVTLTTVGYGDVYPQTIGGKIFTGFLLIIGLGVISVPSGLIASGLTQARNRERESKKDSERPSDP